MSWWDKEGGDGSDAEDDDAGEGDLNTVNDRIIFLIDGRAAMREKNKGGETHLQNSLTIALAVMKSKIIASGEGSSIGLAFFGTKDRESAQDDTTSSSNGVLTLFNLAAPSAQRIRQLQNLIENPNELMDLVQPHPQTAANVHACPLKQALWTCSQSFGSNDYRKSDMKRIWIFTNDDNPNAHSPVEQTATLTVARDCAQAGIEISLWHINPQDRQFDPDLFYLRLLRATTPGAPAVSSADASSSVVTTLTQTQATVSTLSQSSGILDAEGIDDTVQSRIIGAGHEGFDPNMAGVRRKEHKKRRMGSVYFSLTCPSAAAAAAEGGSASSAAAQPLFKHLAVAMYKSIQVAKKPVHKWLYARTNEPIKIVSTYYDTATGETLTSDKIATFLECGAPSASGQPGRVPLNADELKYIKTCGNDAGVGLQLLHFMPALEVTKDLNVESSYFLFPDDKSVKGSSLLFEALLRDLAAKELVGVVRFNRTDSAQPRLAALIPQLEEVDPEDGSQVCPGGFYLVQLPFSEDIRFNPAPKVTATADDNLKNLYRTHKAGDRGLVDVANKLVSAVALPEGFSYTRDIQSPAVQQYYAILQALALNQAEPEWSAEQDDTMVPDSEMLARCEVTGGVFQTFKVLVGINDDVQHAPKKRAAPGEAKASVAAKKLKPSSTTTAAAAAGGGGDGIDVDGLGSFTEAEIGSWSQTGQLAGLSAVQLKSVCRGLGLPVSGTKADLTGRIAAKFV